MPTLNRRSLLQSLGMAAMYASFVQLSQASPRTTQPGDDVEQ